TVIVHAWEDTHDVGEIVRRLALRTGASDAECLRYMEATVRGLGLVALDLDDSAPSRIREDFLRESVLRSPDDRELRDALIYFYAMQSPVDGRTKLLDLLRQDAPPAANPLRVGGALR